MGYVADLGEFRRATLNNKSQLLLAFEFIWGEISQPSMRGRLCGVIPELWPRSKRFGLFFLFNGILTFVGYLMPKLFS